MLLRSSKPISSSVSVSRSPSPQASVLSAFGVHDVSPGLENPLGREIAFGEGLERALQHDLGIELLLQLEGPCQVPEPRDRIQLRVAALAQARRLEEARLLVALVDAHEHLGQLRRKLRIVLVKGLARRFEHLVATAHQGHEALSPLNGRRRQEIRGVAREPAHPARIELRERSPRGFRTSGRVKGARSR